MPNGLTRWYPFPGQVAHVFSYKRNIWQNCVSKQFGLYNLSRQICTCIAALAGPLGPLLPILSCVCEKLLSGAEHLLVLKAVGDAA